MTVSTPALSGLTISPDYNNFNTFIRLTTLGDPDRVPDKDFRLIFKASSEFLIEIFGNIKNQKAILKASVVKLSRIPEVLRNIFCKNVQDMSTAASEKLSQLRISPLKELEIIWRSDEYTEERDEIVNQFATKFIASTNSSEEEIPITTPIFVKKDLDRRFGSISGTVQTTTTYAVNADAIVIVFLIGLGGAAVASYLPSIVGKVASFLNQS